VEPVVEVVDEEVGQDGAEGVDGRQRVVVLHVRHEELLIRNLPAVSSAASPTPPPHAQGSRPVTAAHGRASGRQKPPEGGGKMGKEGGREGGKEGGMETGRETARETGREARRQAGSEGGKEGGRGIEQTVAISNGVLGLRTNSPISDLCRQVHFRKVPNWRNTWLGKAYFWQQGAHVCSPGVGVTVQNFR
jgi:hypothetical protein